MAYFNVFGDEFPLKVVTTSLGIQPTETFKKGDIVKRPVNPNFISTRVLRRKYTSWKLNSGYQESYDINDQLNPILNQLRGKVDELKQLKEDFNLEFLFMIVIKVENNETPATYLKKNIIDFVSAIGAEIHFDIYVIS